MMNRLRTFGIPVILTLLTGYFSGSGILAAIVFISTYFLNKKILRDVVKPRKHYGLIAMVSSLSLYSFLIIPPSAHAKDFVDVNFGIDLVLSSHYQDFIDDAYSGYKVSGGYGWVGILTGLKFNVADQFLIYTNAELLFNEVSADEDYVNSIFLPTLKLMYKFTPSDSFFVNVEINKPVLNTESSRFDFKGSGLGYGFFAGYMIDNSSIIELGMLHIPVDITYDDYAYEENYEFGGLSLRWILSF